jgi:DNA-binding transcriptional MocR family regulator
LLNIVLNDDHLKFEQIAAKIRQGIASGQLRSGFKLPSVRELGGLLGISPVTVSHAYNLLKAEGLIVGKQGSGTHVAGDHGRDIGKAILGRVVESGPLNDFELLSRSSGVKSLASSIADPSFFRLDEFFVEIQELRKEPAWNMYLSPPAGEPKLLAALSNHFCNFGIAMSPGTFAITNGSQHGLHIVLNTLLKPGDTIFVEEPSRLFLSETLSRAGLRAVSIESDKEGLCIDQIERLIKTRHPKAIYCAPSYGASSGSVLAPERLEKLQHLAKSHDILLIEDFSYGELAFEGVPSLFRRMPNVVTVGSFSYSLSPAIRQGFLIADEILAQAFSNEILFSQVSGVGFLQRILGQYIDSGNYSKHLDRTVPKYRSRRDALCFSLRMITDKGCVWSVPKGGLSVWVQLPQNRDSETLYRQALKHGVAFAPGPLVCSQRNAKRFMRLSFSTLSETDLREAVRTLSDLI